MLKQYLTEFVPFGAISRLISQITMVDNIGSVEEAQHKFLAELQEILAEHNLDVHQYLKYEIFKNADGRIAISPLNGFTELLFYGIYVKPSEMPEDMKLLDDNRIMGFNADHSEFTVEIGYFDEDEDG